MIALLIYTHNLSTRWTISKWSRRARDQEQNFHPTTPISWVNVSKVNFNFTISCTASGLYTSSPLEKMQITPMPIYWIYSNINSLQSTKFLSNKQLNKVFNYPPASSLSSGDAPATSQPRFSFQTSSNPRSVLHTLSPLLLFLSLMPARRQAEDEDAEENVLRESAQVYNTMYTLSSIQVSSSSLPVSPLLFYVPHSILPLLHCLV